MYKRKIYDKLLEWKQNRHNEVALLIEGARRIGKSTIVEEFAKNEYDDYIILDFAKENDDIKNEFLTHLSDLDQFFANIFLLKNKTFKTNNCLFIFDEVQLFPKARQAIKYLIQDNRYDYMETGSLIGIKENVENILIPSEEHKIKMYPMDFEEFLWATNDNNTIDVIKKAFITKTPLDENIHKKIMEKFRSYMCIGGMPQAISAFINNKNYSSVETIKREILELYEDDIKKHNKKDNGKASAIFKTLPEQIANRKSHFKFSKIKKTARLQNYIESIDFLEESMIVNIAKNITDPQVLISFYADYSNIKIFFGDTGLFITQIMKDKENISEEDNLYKKIIFNKMSANLGMVYENMVSQMLTAKGYQLLFHKYKYIENNKEKNFEIDFLLRHNDNIYPIEVKSSNYKNTSSLDNFYKKYTIKKHDKYIIYTKNYKYENDTTYLPIYMTICL